MSTNRRKRNVPHNHIRKGESATARANVSRSFRAQAVSEVSGGMPKRSKGAIKSSKRIDGTIDAVYVHKVKDPPTIVQPAHLVWMLGEYHDSNEFVKCLQISKEPFFLRMATKMRT